MCLSREQKDRASGSSGNHASRPRKKYQALHPRGSDNGERKANRDDACHNCGQSDHWDKEYTRSKRGGGEAHKSRRAG